MGLKSFLKGGTDWGVIRDTLVWGGKRRGGPQKSLGSPNIFFPRKRQKKGRGGKMGGKISLLTTGEKREEAGTF